MRMTLMVAAVVLFANVSFAERNDLSGTVYGPNQEPLEDATVYVYTARLKEGTNLLCPSCYADCAKRDKTDLEGRFTIRSLDPELLFEIVIVAEGYSPQFATNVDPSESELSVTLEMIPVGRLDPEFVVRGRIIDPNGSPVAGATVEVEQIDVPHLRQKRSEYMSKLFTDKGEIEDMDALTELLLKYEPDRKKSDALAVTNEQGEFLLTSEYPDATYEVTVRARGLAPKRIHGLRAGSAIYERKLNYGVTVSGYVTSSKAALDQVLVGVVQVWRSLDFFGEYVVGVNDDGYFEIPNLPPKQPYYIYGKMESLQGIGVVDSRRFYAGEHDTRVNTGSLDVAQGLRLSGRVLMPDGIPVPPHTQLLFSRGRAWDTLSCAIGSDGRFDALDLPAGGYTIGLRIPGYHMSDQNHSLDPLNSTKLMGVITEDYAGLEILMEPGELAGGMSAKDKERFARRNRLRTESIRGYETE